MTSAKRISKSEITGPDGPWGMWTAREVLGDVPEPVEVACEQEPLVVASAA